MNNQFKVDIYRYFRLVKFEYKISLAYLMVGLLWILFSDEALALLISDPVLLTKFQTYKGSFYILVTASLLFFMAKKHVGKLEEQQTLFEIMFNTISDCVIIANTNREMVMVNKSTIETFGYAENELLGKTTEMLYESEDSFKSLGEKIFDRQSQQVKSQYLLNYKNSQSELFEGNTFSAKLFDSKGIWIGNMSIIHDLSEQNKAEAQINEGRIKLEAALNSMTDAVFISDRDGHFVNFNDAFAAFHKFKDKAQCAKSLSAYPDFLEVYLPSGELASFEQWAVPRALNGETATNDEYKLRRKDTGETWVGSYSFAPTRDQDGKIIGSVVAARDITQSKLAQQELLKAKEKAEENDRLKTVFLQNISHEILTPMNAIIGFSELLTNPDLSDKKLKKYTQIIINSGNQLLSIVHNILTISILETKQAAVSTTAVDIDRVLQELKTVFGKIASEKDIEFDLDKNSAERCCINTDETKLRQILTNLLSNAFKFTKSGKISFGYDIQQNTLEFFVSDTGIGIKPECQEKIFERFHQADVTVRENYGGTGLGLSIVKEFVTLLGGQMRLESQEGCGATFYFTLPLNLTTQKDEIHDRIIPRLNKPLILVAEDTKLNYLLLKTLLSKLDVKLIHAWNGQEAIDRYEQHPEIDIVIMDLNMPIMDGYQATTLLKKKNPSLPIVALSAYTLPQEIENAKKHGFDAYLTKPVKVNDLDSILEKYFGEGNSQS